MKPKIVLCSGSPRRQELLHRMGIADFDVRVPQAEETCPAGLSPRETVEHISRVKADAARQLCTAEELLITADTMVFLDGQRLGKPRDEAHALEMLTALQGRAHTVCTGMTVMQGDRCLTESEETAVRFRAAEEAELRAYIRTGEPMDKAGAYGVQGLGALFVEGIQGDYFNVVGLPMLHLSRMLGQFGVRFFD
jgi:septum formation protein